MGNSSRLDLVYTSLIFFFFFLSLISCTREHKEEEKSVFEEMDTHEEKLYNLNPEKDSSFKKLFRKRIDHLIKQGKIDSAARFQTLYVYKNSLLCNNDGSIIIESQEFLNKYKIKPLYYSIINYEIANLYACEEDYQNALIYFKRAIISEPKTKLEKTETARAYYDIAYLHKDFNQYEKAINYLDSSLSLYKNVRDSTGIAEVLDIKSGIYSELNDDYNALNYAKEAQKFYKNSKDTNSIMNNQVNYALLLKDLERPQFNDYIDSIVPKIKIWCEKKSYKHYNSQIYYFEILSLLNKNKIVKAKNKLKQFKNKENLNTDEEYSLYYHYALAAFENLSGIQSETESAFLEHIPTLIERKNYSTLRDYYQILFKRAKKEGDYKKALKYNESFQYTKRLLDERILKVKLAELEAKYELNKKELRILNQQKQITKKSTQIYILLASVFLLSLSFLLYHMWRKNRQAAIFEKNRQKFLKQIFENIEAERKRIAADLHDSISHQLLGIKKDIKQAASYNIDKIINDIRRICRDLRPVLFDKIGLEETIKQMVHRIENKNNFLISTNINYENSIGVEKDLQIYRIIQEAINNIIKHSNAYAGKITINQTKNDLLIEIQDNGQGFDVENVLNKNSAYGLLNIIERAKAIGGLVEINSTQKGTKISIII